MRRATEHPLSVAPMMDRTNRHYRAFARTLTRRTLLYTEMVTTGAILFGDHKRHLAFDTSENPLVLQLGGDEPEALARCARLAEELGYDEINLNVGCPSDRVQRGNFGVCLMGQPELVAKCVAAMREAVKVPVSVKHRIGFDDKDNYEDMLHFVDVVSQSGCDRFTVHARKAWLQGLSPKQNRNIPPLRYEDVHRLKRERPELLIEINGGITDLSTVQKELKHSDGVMVGRAAWDNPWMLARVDTLLYGAEADPAKTRHDAVRAHLPYIERMLDVGERLHHLTRPMLLIFAGQPGGKKWRRHLSEHGHASEAGLQTLLDALALVPETLRQSAA
ncbi:MAG TPA: tRNA dihydrouridine(20/20a) synthase DusA [Myxococcales bacterium]|nr:tRNA dihydrouridine(20/20a) synthase DusA [Myxococcales bacterium]HAN31812.1 tRNA dihydrouridine(20/20a) synthase DusA [Myxococcales bacterium]